MRTSIMKLVEFSINRPRVVVLLTAVLTLLLVVQFPRIKIDTDPENMLPADAPVRVFHHETKKEFGLYDFIVLGVVNDKDKDGVFNVDTLEKICRITDDINEIQGVIASEIVALSTKDNIEQGDLGSVRFNWLMEEPPKTREEALRIRDEARDHPMFEGNAVSEDGKALAIMVPIERKDLSYEVARNIKTITRKYSGDEEYHITGLPVAEGQFGVEMFKQMAVSAPRFQIKN